MKTQFGSQHMAHCGVVEVNEECINLKMVERLGNELLKFLKTQESPRFISTHQIQMFCMPPLTSEEDENGLLSVEGQSQDYINPQMGVKLGEKSIKGYLPDIWVG